MQDSFEGSSNPFQRKNSTGMNRNVTMILDILDRKNSIVNQTERNPEHEQSEEDMPSFRKERWPKVANESVEDMDSNLCSDDENLNLTLGDDSDSGSLAKLKKPIQAKASATHAKKRDF